METFMDQLIVFATTYGLKIIGAILILIIGRIAAGIGRKIVIRIMGKSDVDAALIKFVASLTYILIIVFAVIAALAKFGIQTASFVVVLGALGFAIGFALQGSLSNFASGIMILIFRPFKVGDFIIGAGVSGTVKEIGIFNSILSTPDNVKVVVPNSKLNGDVIKNYSVNDNRRLDMVIGIGYSSSIAKAYETIEKILKEDQRVLEDPAPIIAVSELADSSVNFVVRPWVKREDYWDTKFDLTRKIKEQFDANEIEIPFPQHVVHMAEES
jgi:small conductance mechanosensitive channel